MDTPYAKVKMVIDSAPAVYGGQTISSSNSVQLLGENTANWNDAKWEIFEYPDGFSCPAGWVDINGVYTSYDIIPPVIGIPSSLTIWGKYFFRLTVDGGFLNGVFHGKDNPQPLVDESAAVKVLSPNGGLHDVGFNESNQFDSARQYIGELKKTLRLIDDIILAGGTGEVNTGQSIGGGAAVFKDKNGLVLRFKSLLAGSNVSIIEAADTLTISATGEANAGANIGTGAGLYKDKSGLNLRFKSIVAGTGISIVENANDITLSAAGAGPGGSADQVQYNNGSGGFAGATNVKIASGDLVVRAATDPVASAGAIRGSLGTNFVVRNDGNSDDRTVFETYAISGGGSLLQTGGSGTTTLSKVFEQLRFLASNKIALANANFSANVEIGSSDVQIVGKAAGWTNFAFYNVGASPGGATYGSGVGVMFIGEATTLASTDPSDGIILYVDPADNILKYRQDDGTIIVLDGSGGGGTPGGSSGQVQYNYGAGNFAGATNVKIASNNLVVGATLGTAASTGSIRMPVGANIIARNFDDDANLGILEWFDDGAQQELMIGTYGDATSKTVSRLSLNAIDLVYFWIDESASPFQVGKLGTAYSALITQTSNFAIAGNVGSLDQTYFGSGGGVIYIGPASTVPSTNPASGIITYVQSGVLKYRKSDGTVITLDGVTTAAGSSGEFQYNSSGSLAGSSGVLYDTGTGQLKIAATKGIIFRNNADTFSGTLSWNVSAARTIAFPNATGTVVLQDTSDILTNKTLNASNNTITDTSTATGDLFKSNGTKFVRFAKGSSLQVLRVNSGATDLEWATISTGSPGGSSTQVQYNNGGAFGGISGATTDGSTLTVKDANFEIVDDSDTSKKAKFQCSGITASTTRTFTLPDASTTLVGQNTADALSNKTSIAFGSTPAASGIGRYSNNTDVAVMRKADNLGDFQLLKGDGSNNVFLGATTNAGNTYVDSAADVYARGSNFYIQDASAQTRAEFTNTRFRSNSDYVAFAAGTGSTIPSSGRIRISASFESLIVYRRSSADYIALSHDASNDLIVGDTTNGATTVLGASTTLRSKISSTTVNEFTSTSQLAYVPRIGGTSSPYASEGDKSIDINNAGYTLTSNDYIYAFIEFTSTASLTAIRTITMPAPSSTKGYKKFVKVPGGSFATRFSIGSGATADVQAGKGATLFVTSAGVYNVGEN